MTKYFNRAEFPKICSRADFNGLAGYEGVDLYTLENKNGVIAQITNYGARLVSLWVPDKLGILRDIVLGFPSLNDYLRTADKYHGATIGRYANRISGGKIKIDGKKYVLACNSGGNHLHGGKTGFESVIWSVASVNKSILKMFYMSKHMEEGYPGNLMVEILYRLSEENELFIEYKATTDETTIINLTNHSYFNLAGEGEKGINGHILQINADTFTPISENSIPLGTILPLDDTPLDFRQSTAITDRINDSYEQLILANGYDHNYVLNGGTSMKLAASVYEKNTGVLMEVSTDQPGMQFYSTNFLSNQDIGKSGKRYTARSAICLETQHYPNSPNQPNFPSVLLEPSKEFHSTTSYAFRII